MKSALAVLLLGLSICSVSHPAHAGLLFPTPEASAAIKGKVVDAVSGKPLAGVLVVATWHDFTPLYTGGNLDSGPQYSCYELVNVLTAVSGADGSYEFPAWSGKLGHCQFMAVQQPLIGLYKPGYAALHPIDVPVDRAYSPGLDFTISEWNGYTFKMRLFGPHFYNDHNEDNQVSDLTQYAWDITRAFSNDEKGPCFWKEERPMLLMLLQEQRRLSAYASPNLDVLQAAYGISITDQRCTTPEAMATLRQEAQAAPVEQPILPYVRNVQAGQPSAVLLPASKELQAYLAEEDASDREADEKAIVYHVEVNPVNPYYVAMLRAGPRSADAATWQSTSPSAYKPLENKGIYGVDCPTQEPPSIPQYMYMAGASGAVALARPPITDGRPNPAAPMQTAITPSGSAASSADVEVQCSWIVGFLPKQADDVMDLMANMRSPYNHREDYDSQDGTWYLTDQALVPRSGESLPGILEIHGPGSLKVTTTLDPAGPNRWHLPPAGQDFALAITATPAGAVADTCEQALPDSLRLQLARDLAQYRPAHASELATGTAGCADVVKGDFTGSGETSYAFHLMEYGLIQRLAVATPLGAVWSITVLNAKGCLQPKPCVLMPLPSGVYTKTANQWRDPYAPPHVANIDFGERTKLQATNAGFIETWGVRIAYAHFFVDGHWQYVIVDAPSPAAAQK